MSDLPSPVGTRTIVFFLRAIKLSRASNWYGRRPVILNSSPAVCSAVNKVLLRPIYEPYSYTDQGAQVTNVCLGVNFMCDL